MKTIKLTVIFLYSIVFAVSAQTFQQYSFHNVPFGGGGNVTGIITCPSQKNLIFARTDVGGSYRWVEATKSWKCLNYSATHQNMNLVESFAIDHSSPNRVYAACGESYFGSSYLMRSTDYGNTWEFISLAPYFQTYGNSGGGTGGKGSGERLIVDPNKGNILYYGSAKQGLWKSINYGDTWLKVTTFPVQSSSSTNDGICAVEVLKDFGTPDEETPYILISVARGDKVAPVNADSATLYLSTDKGVSWSPISDRVGNGNTKPDPRFRPGNMVYAAGKIYITFGSAPTGVTLRSCLWQYDIENQIWKNVSPSNSTDGGVNVRIHGVSVDNPANPTMIVVSTNDAYVYLPWGKSGSYGDDMYKGIFDINGNISWTKRLIGNNLAEYDSTWFVQNVQIHRGWDVAFDPYNKNRVFITSGNGLYSTDNFTATPSIWYANIKGLEETATMNAVSIPGGKFMLALGDISGAVYNDPTNYGVRFEPAQTVTTSVDYAPQTTSTIMIRCGSSQAANGITGPIMYATDGGILWTGVQTTSVQLTPALPNPLTNMDKGLAYGWSAISADGSTIAWANSWQVAGIKHSSVFYTRDKGATWNEYPLMAPLSTTVTSKVSSSRIYSDKVNPNLFYGMINAKLAVYAWDKDSSKYDIEVYANPTGEKMQHAIQVNPLVEGEFLAWSESKLYLYSNKGKTYKQLTGITVCTMAGWGKAAPGKINPTIFAYGKIGIESTMRIYRSEDMGTTWVRITDNSQQFGGGPLRDLIFGDMNTYGRVFMTNYGLGLVYGEIDNTVYTKSITVVGENNITKVSTDVGTLKMLANFNPITTANQNVMWEVDSTNVATIDAKGLLTLKKDGLVKVNAWALDGSGIFGSGTITIKHPTDVEEMNSKLVSVYPNPFKKSTTIYSDKTLDYKIISLEGVLVEWGTITGNSEVGKQLSNGIYILEVKEQGTLKIQSLKLLNL